MFSFLESGHYFGTAKKEIVDNQFETEGVFLIDFIVENDFFNNTT